MNLIGEGANATARKRRILFVGESVSLAHVGRPLALLAGLTPDLYELHFACAECYSQFVPKEGVAFHPIFSISPQAFMAALAKGKPIYDSFTLQRYIRDDLELLEQVKPDVVVGDFRISLAISARVSNIPYVNIINAHWSRYASDLRFVIPDHPLVQLFGFRIANFLFSLFRPLAFWLHAGPMNMIRNKYGLTPLHRLQDIYCDADWVFYADSQQLVPTKELPSNHSYIGPIIWAPDVPFPEWWGQLDHGKPIVYVTLGSSGQVDVLPVVISAVKSLSIQVLLASAGRFSSKDMPPNVFSCDYLPGDEVSKIADLVICNGGSATAYQALSCGVPVFGIPSNLDQHLTMGAIASAGAGALLRAENVSVDNVMEVVNVLLGDERFRERAMALKANIESYDPATIFREFLENCLLKNI